MPPLTAKQVDGVVRDLVQSFFARAGEAGMSYRDMAPLVGVTYQTMNNWARGTMPGDLHSILALMRAKAHLDALPGEEIEKMKHSQALRRQWVKQTTEAGR